MINVLKKHSTTLTTQLNQKHLHIIVITIAILILIMLSAAKIHGSSIGMFYTYLYGFETKDPNLLFGTPRAIRSDEWNVSTSLTASQSWNKYQPLNQYSNNQNLITPLDIPTTNWTTLFKPNNWAFILLPFENAFAFRWWFKAELFILASFLLIWKLTRKNYFFAFFGSLMFFFAPYNQWWYSGSANAPIETITYTIFIILTTIKLIEAKDLRQFLGYGLLLTYFELCFIFLIYPPFQVSIGLLIIFFLTAYFFQKLRDEKIPHLKSLLLTITGSTILTVIITVIYYLTNREIIDLISHTIYPGNRFTSGGNFTLPQLFSGFFNSYLLSDYEYTSAIFMNKSEAANFLILYPFLFPLLIYKALKKQLNYLFISLLIFLILTTSWLFFSFPPLIAKLTLFNRIPESRMILAIGFANYLLLILYLFTPQLKNRRTQTIALISGIIAAILHILLGAYFLRTDYFYFRSEFIQLLGNNSFLILISLIVFLAVYTLIAQHKKSWLFIMLIFSIYSSSTVNPIYKGLAIFQTDPIAVSIRQIAQDSNDGNWMVYDNFLLSSFLFANQIKTVSGINMYPKFNQLYLLDKNHKYENIYNRFGYINFKTNELNNITFMLSTPDSYSIYINPCQKELDFLNIKYVVFNSPQSESCLREIKKFELTLNPVYIYQRI